MKAIVNEPHVEYKVSNWKNRKALFQVDNNILKMEFDTIYVSVESLFQILPVEAKKKVKISSLKGKLKKLSEQEIDFKLSDLRNEWERNF